LPYTFPILAAVGVLAAVPRAMLMKRRLADWHAAMHRTPGDMRPGPGHFEVMTEGAVVTNLGFSPGEYRKSSGTVPEQRPKLTSPQPVVLRIVGGPQIRLPAGASIHADAIVGVHRRLLDSVTTATGIEHRFTYEVPPGTRFFLRMTLPRLAASHDSAYRDDRVIDVLPASRQGAFFISGAPFTGRAMLGVLILAAMIGGIVSFIGGLMLTMMWRTGCRSGKSSIPEQAVLDAVALASVGAMLAMHIAIGGEGKVIKDTPLPPRA